jgi:uncharacterized ion transporter superfamily protein YfcC
VFTSIPRGLEAAAEIIFFILIIGGAFSVLRGTGAIDAMLAAALRRLGHRPLLLVLGGLVVFVAGSSTIGMAEEYIPFIPVLVALALALRYDAVVGVAIVTLGYSIGYGVATINPFTVLIAQDVAGLQPGSGMWYRLVLTAVFLPIGAHHIWRYATKVRNDPAASLVAGVPVPRMEQPAAPADAGAQRVHRHAPGGAAGGRRSAGGAGVGPHHAGLVPGGDERTVHRAGRGHHAAGPHGHRRRRHAVRHGAAELAMTALLVGFARAIQVVLDDGGVIDTIVHGLSVPLQAMGPSLAAVGMMVVQSLTNLFIPSGSGQAYVTMPIMAPLADVVGVPRQVAVLAFQFGDGFTNILVPTNPVIIGILAVAGVPYERWLRFVIPFMLKVWFAGALALVVAVWLNVQ